MKPRIFVSSTFYDLKYIREDLSNFIKSHDFEPILFEDGDIGYTPYSALDDSCYRAIESADMALLIVGGNYGSPASGEQPDEFKEFISVTRREFQKGVERGVPFFVFVDRNVYAEYGIYDMNSKEIDSGTYKINFRSTKNINVFRFIKEIQSIKQISITEFGKISDIKDFLSKQWSDMFKNYLASLKEEKEIEKLQDTMNNMNVLIEKMDKILNAVGKEVLKDVKEEYEQILEENKIAEIKSICLSLSKTISINVDRAVNSKRKDHVQTFLNALIEMYEQQIQIANQHNNQIEELHVDDATSLIYEFEQKLKEIGMTIRVLKFNIFEEINQIYPYLNDPEKMKDVYAMLCSSPFYHRIFRITSRKLEEETTESASGLLEK